MPLPRFRPTRTWVWIIAVAVFAIALPAGALAATGTSIVIVDGSHPNQKAKVTAQGRLATTLCGASCAAVDGGSLRVGGSVAAVPASPAKPWTTYCSSSSAAVSVSCAVAPPAGHGMEVTTISVRATVITGGQFPYIQCDLHPGASTGFVYLPAQLTGTYSGQDYYLASIPVETHIDANETMNCTALRTPTTGTAYLVVSVVGYQT